MIGGIFKVIGMTIWVGTGLWGFFLCLAIISKAAGFWGIVAAIFLGPITFIAAPLYAGFAWDNWFPLVLNYGGAAVSFIVIALGGAMSKG